MEFFLDLLVTAVSLAIVAQHVWALRGHFHSERMAVGAQLTSAAVILTCLYFLLLLWAGPQPSVVQLIGIIIELSGLALFWWAVRASRAAGLRFAFDEERPRILVTTGPYQRIRHPFYASYLLFWIGWAVTTWSWEALIPLAIITALYVVAARFEERLFANTPLATEYDAYRRRAGLFWPKP